MRGNLNMGHGVWNTAIYCRLRLLHEITNNSFEGEVFAIEV